MSFKFNKKILFLLLLFITQINTALFAVGGEIDKDVNIDEGVTSTSSYRKEGIPTVDLSDRESFISNMQMWKWDTPEARKALISFLSPLKKSDEEQANNILNNLFENHSDNLHILKIDSFLVNTDMKLGYGDEGSVFLALHKPSNYLVACKQTSRLGWNGEAENLSALKRLYGYYYSEALSTPFYSLSYLFMPLVIGQRIDYLAWASEFEKESLHEELLRLNALTEAYLRELTYIEDSRVYHGEPTSEHYMATMLGDKTYVMAIDLSPRATKEVLNKIKDKDGKYPLCFTHVLVLRYIYRYFPNAKWEIHEKKHPHLNNFREEIEALSDKTRCSDDNMYVKDLVGIYEKFKPLLEKEIKGLGPSAIQ